MALEPLFLLCIFENYRNCIEISLDLNSFLE